jgi:hypothetical protein
MTVSTKQIQVGDTQAHKGTLLTCSHGSSSIDLCHNLVGLVRLKDTVASIFGNGGVWKDINLGTIPKMPAGTAGICCRAGRIDLATKTVRRFGRTGKVRLACVVWNETLRLDELVDAYNVKQNSSVSPMVLSDRPHNLREDPKDLPEWEPP